MSRDRPSWLPTLLHDLPSPPLIHLPLADDMACLVPVAPYNILEPPNTYADGSPRETGE